MSRQHKWSQVCRHALLAGMVGAMGIFGLRFSLRRERTRRLEPPDERRLKLELEHAQLVNEGVKLRNDAIKRVVDEAANPIEALEVVAVATHSGRGSPIALPRRAKADDPLQQLALKMIDKQMTADPMAELDRVIERHERLEEVADQMTGGRRRRTTAGGDGIGDTIASLADTQLGQALGAALGMRIANAGTPAPQIVEAPSGVPTPEPAALPADPERPSVAPPPAAPFVNPQPSGAQPMNIRVGVALRMLRAMKPEQAARWLWDNAEGDEMLSQLLDTAIATEPDALPALLEAICGEASAHPEQAQWLPLLQELRDSRVFTMGMHAALREIAAAEPQLEAAAP